MAGPLGLNIVRGETYVRTVVKDTLASDHGFARQRYLRNGKDYNTAILAAGTTARRQSIPSNGQVEE